MNEMIRYVRKYLLTLLVVIFAVSCAIFGGEKVQASSQAWTGETDTTWYDQNQTSSEYTIHTAEELAGLAYLVNEKGITFEGRKIVLGSDIILNEGSVSEANDSFKQWIPIGGDNTFKGNFDGNGKYISGLYYKGTSTYIGLFGCTSTNSIVNLTVKNGYLESNHTETYMGGIIGRVSENTSLSNCTVENIKLIHKAADFTDSLAYSYFGFAVGENITDEDEAVIENVTMIDCELYVLSSTNPESIYAGGITGQGYNSHIIGSSVIGGKIIVEAFRRAHVGGITGVERYGKILNTWASLEKVSATLDSSTFELGIGGFAGVLQAETKNCYSTTKLVQVDGESSIVEEYIGGFAGIVLSCWDDYYEDEAYFYGGILENAYSTTEVKDNTKALNRYTGLLIGILHFQQEKVGYEIVLNKTLINSYYQERASVPGIGRCSSYVEDKVDLSKLNLTNRVTKVTSQSVKSGELAYNLNKKNDDVWVQGSGYPVYRKATEKPIRKVTFVSGNTTIATKYTDTLGKIIVPGAPSMKEAYFQGWYVGSTKISSGTVYTKDTVVTARFVKEVKSYTSVQLSKTTFTYNGKSQVPTVTIKDGSKVLKQGTDYKLAYKNTTNVGTGSIIVTGLGNYTGTKTVTFRIVAKSISSQTKIILSSTNHTYSGKEKKPSVKVTDGTKTLLLNKDYTLTYKNNKSIGTATVTITGKGNYSGKKYVSFTIKPRKISFTKLKSNSRKSMTVYWKKDTTVTGYQVVYATDKNFTKGKKISNVKGYKVTSKKVTSLKSKKTYYVKIRGYKVVSGKVIYGDYSIVRKVRVR